MPRDGNGQYQAPPSSWNPGVNGANATTADFNNLLNDLEAGISQSVSSDGQTPMTGPLDMGNNRITNLAAAIAVTDAVTLGQFQNAAGQWQVFAGTPTFISANSFSVTGDQTATFPLYTRVRTTNTGGTVYGTVISSVFGAVTTVTLVTDNAASLDSGLSAVATGTQTVANPSLPGTQTQTPFRNRIVNGRMRFDLVSQGTAQTITAGQPPRFGTEMFYAQSTGANITAQRIAGSGYEFATRLTGAASVTTTAWGTRIEGQNCTDWVGQQIAVQVPISSSSLTTITWTAYYANAVDDWTSRTLIATGSLTLSTSVATKYFVFNAGANAANGIGIEFTTGPLLGTQTLTFQGAFQAEKGTPTPYEEIDVGEDQARVFRYVYTTYDRAAPATLNASANRRLSLAATSTSPGVCFQISLPVRMRGTPTVTIYNPVGGTIGTMQNESAGTPLGAQVLGSAGVDEISVVNSGGAAAATNTYSIHIFAAARLT
jgi:hypothetical protein